MLADLIQVSKERPGQGAPWDEVPGLWELRPLIPGCRTQRPAVARGSWTAMRAAARLLELSIAIEVPA